MQLSSHRPARLAHGQPRRRLGGSRVAAASSSAPQQLVAQRDQASTSTSRNLVVAIDGEEGSMRAINWTLEHLYREGDVLHLLHVVPLVVNVSHLGAYNLAASLGPEEELQRKLAAHCEAFVHAQCGPLAAKHNAQWELDLVHGRCNTSISDTIISKCNDLDAAMVVLSVRPAGLLEGLFQSGVSKQVAARCKRPTLIYHEE